MPVCPKLSTNTLDRVISTGGSKLYKIAVMPGDGTGPEVTAEAVKVLRVAADKFGFKTELTEFDFGGERYKRTGETLPDSACR